MRIGMMTNNLNCEYEMQEVFGVWLKRKGIRFVEEFSVPEVSRRADFLLFVQKVGFINVEAKCTDVETMVKQMDDHAKYCEYCFAYIPDYCPTPKWFKEELVKKGYGLFIFNYREKTVTEVLEAHRNWGIDKGVQVRVMKRYSDELKKKGR